MINGKDNKALVLYSRTYNSDNDDNAIVMTVPKEFAEELGIENCKVSMTVIRDFSGRKHLLITKYSREIIAEEYDYNK